MIVVSLKPKGPGVYGQATGYLEKTESYFIFSISCVPRVRSADGSVMFDGYASLGFPKVPVEDWTDSEAFKFAPIVEFKTSAPDQAEVIALVRSFIAQKIGCEIMVASEALLPPAKGVPSSGPSKPVSELERYMRDQADAGSLPVHNRNLNLPPLPGGDERR